MTPKNYQTSYYEILQISPQADNEEIKRAYRRLALRFHPDKHPLNKHVAELRFRLITEAYNQLSTAEKRNQYNYARFGIRANADDQFQPRSSTWGSHIAEFFRPTKKRA